MAKPEEAAVRLLERASAMVKDLEPQWREDTAMDNPLNALIAESMDNYSAALLIAEALNGAELDFPRKSYEIFRDCISELVKARFHDAEYLEEGEGANEWDYLKVPIGGDYRLHINYDMQSMIIKYTNKTAMRAVEKNSRIRETMSAITGAHNEKRGKEVLWSSLRIKYPGLENIDNDILYKYALYRVYADEPQSAADRIVSMVNDLRNAAT